ncbi:C2 domain-containing protein [Aphelenchoides bicaudatus]|nr:C2 domain-containing protein [Aphelenchoides bicaudatus]
MSVFNGTAKIRVLEAKELRPTEWSKRFNNVSESIHMLDAYVNIDCDEYNIGKTQTKPKTNLPQWNEEYQTAVHNGKVLGFTTFNDCALPPDEFVANCRVCFEDLKINTLNDIWVDLEPHGQLHLLIELSGSMTDGQYF